MKTIKINEKQARMLKEISEPKVMKVTKEQYNTILEMERIKEIDLVSNEGDNFDIIKTNDAYYISNRTTDYSPQDTAYIGSVQEIGNDKKKLCSMAAREFETLFEGISEGLYEDRRAEYEDMKNNAIGSEPYQQACKINMSEFISDPAHPISMAFRRELNEEGSTREMYEEFVNELYNVNEGGEIKYESLIKLMETVGLIENRRIKKESFRNDKAIVEKVISAGLYEMCNGGSKYKAMEAMEEALNVDPSFVSSKTGKSPEELKAFIDAKRADSNKLVTKADVERDRMNSKMGYDPESEDVRDDAVDALVDGMKDDQKDMKDEAMTKIKEEGNREDWTGDEILNHPMLAKLPTDVMKAENRVYFKLPSLDGGHSATLATHMGHVMDWIHNFKFTVKEIPVVDSEMNVLNKGYVGRDIEKLRAISNTEKEYGDRGFNTDETTADSSGQSTGSLADVKNAKHKTNVVPSLKTKDEDEEPGEDSIIPETNASSSGEVFKGSWLEGEPGFDVEAGNKENKHEPVSEDAFSETQWQGGSFVKPKDKCAKFPYCDEGPGAIEIKKTKKSVISNDALHESVSKKTGRTIKEVKMIFEGYIEDGVEQALSHVKATNDIINKYPNTVVEVSTEGYPVLMRFAPLVINSDNSVKMPMKVSRDSGKTWQDVNKNRGLSNKSYDGKFNFETQINDCQIIRDALANEQRGKAIDVDYRGNNFQIKTVDKTIDTSTLNKNV